MTLKRWILAGISTAILITAVVASMVRASEPDPTTFGAEWAATRTAFVQGYESKHGEIDNATEMWLFSNAHRMCWWLNAEPRLPSEALEYGITELQMSSDQTITVAELGMQLIADCPDYNPQKGEV